MKSPYSDERKAKAMATFSVYNMKAVRKLKSKSLQSSTGLEEQN